MAHPTPPARPSFALAPLLALLALPLAGCPQRIAYTDDAAPVDSADVAPDAPPEAGEDVQDVHYRDVPIQYDVYHPDVCQPDAVTGVTMYNCDPYNPTVGCDPGTACYPYIEYPFEPCGSEIYHAECLVAGAATEDEFCDSTQGCAAGFSCFVTGAGNRCLQLCHIDGTGTPCPRGKICQTTDLPDIGACD